MPFPPYPFSNTSLHTTAINVVRNLLASHDADHRFQNPEVKARIAALYLPIVGIIMDSLGQLYDPNMDARARHSPDAEVHGINQHVAMAIASSSVYGVPSSSAQSGQDRYEPVQRVRNWGWFRPSDWHPVAPFTNMV